MRALNKIKKWEVVELPKRKKKMGQYWVFTIKYRVDGSIERHKGRLVGKVYTQTYDNDYRETFALVVKMNSISILSSLAVNLDWPLHNLM